MAELHLEVVVVGPQLPRPKIVALGRGEVAGLLQHVPALDVDGGAAGLEPERLLVQRGRHRVPARRPRLVAAGHQIVGQRRGGAQPERPQRGAARAPDRA